MSCFINVKIMQQPNNDESQAINEQSATNKQSPPNNSNKKKAKSKKRRKNKKKKQARQQRAQRRLKEIGASPNSSLPPPQTNAANVSNTITSTGSRLLQTETDKNKAPNNPSTPCSKPSPSRSIRKEIEYKPRSDKLIHLNGVDLIRNDSNGNHVDLNENNNASISSTSPIQNKIITANTTNSGAFHDNLSRLQTKNDKNTVQNVTKSPNNSSTPRLKAPPFRSIDQKQCERIENKPKSDGNDKLIHLNDVYLASSSLAPSQNHENNALNTANTVQNDSKSSNNSSTPRPKLSASRSINEKQCESVGNGILIHLNGASFEKINSKSNSTDSDDDNDVDLSFESAPNAADSLKNAGNKSENTENETIIDDTINFNALNEIQSGQHQANEANICVFNLQTTSR